ncbi:biotin-dependent carboxyltransferase family protein [Streptomyces abyssomicinicus]|uniref:5-oxoprolinase subunit C family protein n=1 Tax=Streptomyces abyssomicinicus TaxID=574929 RepID=UPI00124FFFAA|nr:biotin-dependent carboxyltransferase family protein [Streptomyces abyssomicinicus]
MTTAALEVLATGPLATVQDLGRPGLAAVGVGLSGAADRGSLRLANRLVGNEEGAAGVEVTFGGLSVRARRAVTVAVTGAACPLTTGAMNSVVHLAPGQRLTLGTPVAGLRSYLAVRGGIAVPAVLGSRSRDVLAGLGPAPLAVGDVLPAGPPPAAPPCVDLAPVAAAPSGEVLLRVRLGPRDDWFTGAAVRELLSAPWTVGAASDRVGMRMDGPALPRAVTGELPSEGMVPGALQVPPGGRPVLFLADHPVTGGYPVIAVVLRDDLDRAAQARPGQALRFTCAAAPARR